MGIIFRNMAIVSLLVLCVWPEIAVTDDQSEQSCDADEFCEFRDAPICGLLNTVCGGKKRRSIYSEGGTAQAYKPGAPESSVVCDPKTVPRKLKVASWPYSRSSRAVVPEIKLRVHLMSCSSVEDEKKANSKSVTSDCCCESLRVSENATIEVWQTQPDGTYSSLRAGHDEGICRAQQILEVSSEAMAEFSTLAPGSTGVLGGLGPGKRDYFPYGPPFIHVLVTSIPELDPLLINVPVLFHYKTLEYTQFRWRDWRGGAWVNQNKQPTAFNISRWEPKIDENIIEMDLDVFLRPRQLKYSESSLDSMFCHSWMYGLPESFFLEPMAVCGSTLLDYFAL